MAKLIQARETAPSVNAHTVGVRLGESYVRLDAVIAEMMRVIEKLSDAVDALSGDKKEPAKPAKDGKAKKTDTPPDAPAGSDEATNGGGDEANAATTTE